ncbi:MAG: helix-turn-helix domain-containing protein [Planctomycetota bacterium]
MTSSPKPSAVQTLSPKDLSRALGVGESSVKRWIDGGQLPAAKTAGGHRRIELVDALRFIRDGRRQVADPSLLGLDIPQGLDLGDADAVRAEYIEALERGDQDETTSIACQLAALGGDVPAVLDDPVWASFRDIRGRCTHPSEECVTLHRSQANCIAAARRLKELATPAADSAPIGLCLDIGYEIDGMGAHLAETVFAHAGFRTHQAGHGVPKEIACGSIVRVKPDVVWLSANGAHQADLKIVEATAQQVATQAARYGSRLIVSGDAMPDRRVFADDVTEVASMSEFAAFLAGFERSGS